MTSEQREHAWMILGLKGAFEMMEASCLLSERITEDHLNNHSLTISLMRSIAGEIIKNRID